MFLTYLRITVKVTFSISNSLHTKVTRVILRPLNRGHNMKSTLHTISQQSSLYPAAFNRTFPVVKSFFVSSNNWQDLLLRPRVAIVGSRKLSPYGRAVTQKIASELAEQGIVIVSGLAYGADICAHQAALSAGGQTIAVLPGSLQNIYPGRHEHVARKMVEQGGALISEYAEGERVFASHFIARNRIVAALANVVLVTEAALKSGTLHTARFALEQGIDVMAVPGNVTSPTSEGTNNLIKSGAGIATCTNDVFQTLGLTPIIKKAVPKSDDPHQQLLINILADGPCNGETLQQKSNLAAQPYSQALTMLEICGSVTPLGGDVWQLA